MIFISYRRSDGKAFADRLCESLGAEFEMFIDSVDIAAGARFGERIESSVAKADVVIVLIGQSWLTLRDAAGRRKIDLDTDWVHREVRWALNNRRTRVIPVLMNDTPMPDAKALPKPLQALTNHHFHRIREDDWRGDVQELIRVVAAGRVRKSLRRRRNRIAFLLVVALLGLAAAWGVRQWTADAFAGDRGLAAVASHFRETVHDCAGADPEVYHDEIGFAVPVGKDANRIVRCEGDHWSAYFIGFASYEKRAGLFNQIGDGAKRWPNGKSWGSWVGPIPDGQVMRARVCYRAGHDHLGIYWEPAEDDYTSASRYAAVLVAAGIEPDALIKIWDNLA